MTGWLLLGSVAASEAFRAAAGLFLLYRLLHTKRPGAGAVSAAMAGMSIAAAAVMCVASERFFGMVTAIEAVWLALLAYRFLGAGLRMGLCISIYYGIAASFWQFLLSAGLCIASGEKEFGNPASVQGQAACWLLDLLFAALAVYAQRKPDMGRRETFRLFSAIALAGFFSIITLGAWNEQNGKPVSEDTLFMWVIFAVVLLMAVLVLYVSRQYEVEKELAALKSEQAALLERDYTALNRAYAVNARLFHDFHNHIGALRRLLEREKYEEAIQYLDGLLKPIQEMADTVWTGEETTDYLINSKAAEAARRQIRFAAQAEFPRHTNLNSTDLCAILGNLLDNALEAAAQVPDLEERMLSLTIRRINRMLVIKVENTFSGSRNLENGTLKTTKNEAGLHGWGLKSVRAAVQKYDGTVRTSFEGNHFTAVVILSYENRT